MNSLEQYPDLMTKEEVAEVLRCRPSMVNRLVGLRKTRIGNGRGKVLFRKQDVIEYINSKVEREEVIKVAGESKGKTQENGGIVITTMEGISEDTCGITKKRLLRHIRNF